jgi:hybrid cluster-associated redox disulfide protein
MTNVTKNTTISEIMETKGMKGAELLLKAGLHCISCGGAMYESLEQGCLMHGMTQKQIDNLVIRLNNIGKKKKATKKKVKSKGKGKARIKKKVRTGRKGKRK